MRRREALAKLTGREQYVDDLPLDGFLWGMTVRSPAPRGRVTGVRLGTDVDWSQCVLVDHRDILGPNVVALIEEDQPVLAAGYVRHVHEPVMLVAHASREAARRAVRSIEVTVAAEPTALDFRAAPTREQIQYGTDNVLKHLKIEKGDVDRALARAPVVVSGTYETGAQEHVYLETQGMIAYLEAGVLVVKGSMQCPYYVLKALQHALARDETQVRVIQTPTGGGFGGKEEFPSHIALHAALLALKSGRPVKLIYDRGEDMAATTKRHPALVRHRTGLSRDGRLLAQDIEVVIDGGAYVTLSPVVLSRAIIHAAGPYACDHVRITGRAMFTNAVPFGAFRGFGAPQTQFAGERHMDVIARTLAVDPVELRRVNLLKDGQTTATGQVIQDGTDRLAVMERALELSRYREKKVEHAAFNATHDERRRGMGLATFYHGAGFTGGGEVALQSRLRVAGRADGGVEVLSANIEMGQGTLTVFTELAAARLGLEPDDVTIAEADTSRVPNSGPTVASRTTMIVGGLVERAADDLRRRVGLDSSARGPTVKQAIRRWHVDHPGEPLYGEAAYEKPPGITWDDKAYRGDAYGAFAWATYVAEVEVDLRTCATRVLDFTAVQEVGKVLNPTLARGQVQGGVVQGIGWALMEDCKWQDGAMANNQLTNYLIPTSDDVPAIRVAFLENPYPYGAGGAKGLGELPIDGPAPAIVNAVAAATGADAREIPLTPERLMELVDGPSEVGAQHAAPLP
ncbi:MAG TPA: xanthine dehydrogenase family protein molybdopterin-binding subunit [Gemmatimonadales bacterium]|nr:xanthine dehydrogenase family protein molybdopterin-binding subunit [Gemmatimonadales bacterium]